MNMNTYTKSALKECKLNMSAVTSSDLDDSSRVVCSKYSSQGGCRLFPESSRRTSFSTSNPFQQHASRNHYRSSEI